MVSTGLQQPPPTTNTNVVSPPEPPAPPARPEPPAVVYGIKRSIDPGTVGRENITVAPVYSFSSTFATAGLLRAEMAKLKTLIDAELEAESDEDDEDEDEEEGEEDRATDHVVVPCVQDHTVGLDC